MNKPQAFDLPDEFPGAIHYGQEEIDAVSRVLQSHSPFRYYGPDCQFEVEQFENELGRFLSVPPGQEWPEDPDYYVTAVNSGTGALEVALDALGVGIGDEVIVSGFMWISSISAIIRNRAIPVLVDSDDTYGLDPVKIREAITPRTKVVMPVPMLGGSSRIGAIMEVIREVNAERNQQGLSPVRVLEDCAQCLGAHAYGAPGSKVRFGAESIYRLGTFGDVSIFSLQINKNISAGEGGMIVTRDPILHRRIEALHNAGYAKDTHPPENWYGDVPIGWGHGRRMTELQAAVARVQLRKLDSILVNMRRSHDRFEQRLKELDLVTRARADETNPGDSGYYCVFQLPEADLSEEERIQRGRKIAEAFNEWNLHPWFLHDFEVHVYYNIQPLVEKWPLNDGGPWEYEANSFHKQYSYAKGTLTKLDELFMNSIGFNVPSQLTIEQEDKILEIIDYVYHTHIQPK